MNAQHTLQTRRRKGAGNAQSHPDILDHFVTVVQDLSLARNIETIMEIVRLAARELTGADGATFVLREGNQCYYAEENAIAPLWKGLRFPMETCISGWAMMHRKHAVIEDIYADDRIPQDAYRPTFVKSLVMVPIRSQDPIGAIGNYWAKHHRASPQEVRLLQSLADTTAVAIENVNLIADLEKRVKDRTAELEAANEELEAFSSAVSHDLRAPLRHIKFYTQMILDTCADTLNEEGKTYFGRVQKATARMDQLVEHLMALSHTTHTTLKKQKVNLSHLAREIAADLQTTSPNRKADFVIEEALWAEGDPDLLRVALENLISNAWKFTAKTPCTRIEIGTMTSPDASRIYYIKDNGIGFSMDHADRIFNVFERLHTDSDFPGTGVGLATVHRIIQKHGGAIWPKSEVNQGATFYFTLG